MVFNGVKGNYDESDETDPVNYYGQTKLEGENYIMRTVPNSAMVRSALIYGHSLSETRSFSEWMLLKWQQQQQVPLFVDQYRTPILVDNLAQALLELADSDFTGILHLGGPQRINRLDFGIIFAKILYIPAELILPTRMDALPGCAPRPKDTSLNITLALQVLKTPIVDCQAGIQYLKNKNWLVV
jgi:dTDP-4-dehydrorhamnose reductase